MAYKIFKQGTLPAPKHINVIIYGDPSIGKTTLANSCNKMLLLDCEVGAYRGDNMQDVARFTKWSDIQDMFFTEEGRKDIMGYETIVVDTLDSLLNFIKDYIRDEESNPRVFNSKPNSLWNSRTSALTQQGYGMMKNIFTQFHRACRFELNKDVVMLCHSGMREVGGIRKIAPQIEGGSYDIATNAADIMGYARIWSGQRTIDFSPNDDYDTKGAGGMGRRGRILIPDLVTHPDNMFMAAILDDAKLSIAEGISKRNEAVGVVSNWREQLLVVENVKELNGVWAVVQAQPEPIKAQLKKDFKDAAQRVGATYHKEDRCFKSTVNTEA